MKELDSTLNGAGVRFVPKTEILSNSARTEMQKLSNVEKHCVCYF